MEKFSDLAYTRPDIEQFKKDYAAKTQAFKEAKTYEEAKKLYFEIESMMKDLSTTHTLASVRNTMDTTDEFYDKEMDFLNEAIPTLIPYDKAFNQALLSTPFRKEFEQEFGVMIFRTTENEELIRSEAIVEDLVEESKLCTDYSRTAAACKTTFRGEECNFYGLLKHMESTDREERREAYHAWAKLYEDASEELDKQYDRLIQVRVAMAKKLGFSSYTQLAYKNNQRLDYTAEDVANFRQQIVDVVVPACQKLREKQAKRLGLDSLKYYDEPLCFPDGNANPIGDKDFMVAQATKMYHELSPETGEFFDFMTRYELFDLETRPGKHLGGYCTSLPKYQAPFIFSNFNGTSADVDVLTHEAGHAFQCYSSSRTQPLVNYEFSTSEVSEIHSMSMETFTFPWMQLFFGENAEKYRFSHLCDSLWVMPYMACVDEFQHRVYEKPEMTAKERRGVWHELEQKYLPWRDYDGVSFLEEGGFWMQKQHIFLYPFYYIDYALAQTCAFQLYGRMKEDQKTAWSDYLRLCRAGGSLPYFELLKVANLSNPFASGSVEQAVSHVLKELEESQW